MNYSYLELRHLDAILKIEQESNPFPWTELNFKDCLDKGYYSLALELNKSLIGFAIMAISSEESHLLNIGINKEERGTGYGEKLLKKMIIAAEVMGSKPPARIRINRRRLQVLVGCWLASHDLHFPIPKSPTQATQNIQGSRQLQPTRKGGSSQPKSRGHIAHPTN